MSYLMFVSAFVAGVLLTSSANGQLPELPGLDDLGGPTAANTACQIDAKALDRITKLESNQADIARRLIALEKKCQGPSLSSSGASVATELLSAGDISQPTVSSSGWRTTSVLYGPPTVSSVVQSAPAPVAAPQVVVQAPPVVPPPREVVIVRSATQPQPRQIVIPQSVSQPQRQVVLPARSLGQRLFAPRVSSWGPAQPRTSYGSQGGR